MNNIETYPKGTIEYKGYHIEPWFNYSDGTRDFNVYRPDGETGYIEHGRTLSQVKASIDEKLNEG